MKIEQFIKIPVFDTGQYEDSEFLVSGGNARLTMRFSELPPFEIKFHRARWYEFTALPNCNKDMIESSYFRLTEVAESTNLKSFVAEDRSLRKAYKELHHYQIFLDETGCYEIFAESVSAGPVINALPLDDDERWANLRHAYGPASDIPLLLRQLPVPPVSGGDDIWFSLWSALAHQGDVYSASFAAVPHIVRLLSIAPAKADSNFFHFPAWVETCRQKTTTPIPEDLRQAYFAALAHLPSLVAAAADREWDETLLVCILSTIAAVKGYGPVAEAAQELIPAVATEFMEWFFER